MTSLETHHFNDLTEPEKICAEEPFAATIQEHQNLAIDSTVTPIEGDDWPRAFEKAQRRARLGIIGKLLDVVIGYQGVSVDTVLMHDAVIFRPGPHNTVR